MKKVEKVVGTSFYKQDLMDFNLDFTLDLPETTLDAFIVPEPSNSFDQNAKRVEVVSPFYPDVRHHIGYLGKDSVLYNTTKSYTVTEIPCQVNIKAWSTQTKKGKPMNDSYKVILDDTHSEAEAKILKRLYHDEFIKSLYHGERMNEFYEVNPQY